MSFDVVGLARERGEVAGSPDDEPPLPFIAPPVCYRTCCNGRCDYCCLSPYTPTFCWPTAGQCSHKCHRPPAVVRRALTQVAAAKVNR
ncbi:hypothetical protein HU200_021666 [Digitaria exilis]|uniref:Uncharacterized protein n=1 Tax=Digitaria exilis TaxID=1010633 RepID=A0A835EZG0_9POAL|nr:hypothetical protein HU200_021666 [Digitaria exilis]